MKLVIIGAGTAAINVADILVKDRNFRVFGFIGTAEEEAKLGGKKLYDDIPFLGNRKILKKIRENDVMGFIVAIGDNFIREKAYYEASLAGLTPINAISRHAIIEPSAIIGKGIVISTGCILAHDVSIGNNTYIGSGVIIEINTKIGENCHLYPGSIVGGKCDIGRNVTVGVRATIKSLCKIGKNQNIKIGTVVDSNLEDLVRDR